MQPQPRRSDQPREHRQRGPLLEEQHSDRRHEKRTPAAFAFWIQNLTTRLRRSAWMLEMSARGAAFLSAATEAPSAGELLELHPMRSNLPSVDEMTPPLPPHARVMRVDQPAGETRRVAIRFEIAPRSPLAPKPARAARMTLSREPSSAHWLIERPATTGSSAPRAAVETNHVSF